MNSWIGVDLDGTLAKYDGWTGGTRIGDPVPDMVEIVKGHLKRGYEVKIFTARVGPQGRSEHSVDEIRTAIQDWCEKHIGHRLEVTNEKDFGMVALYDDRAIAVEPNTGRTFQWRTKS